MANAFDRISTEYSARADIVSRGGWPGLGVGLKRWFQVLDSEPEIKAIVTELQNSVDYQSWSNGARMDAERTGRIDFPVEDPKCTALRLAMFRAFSHDENQAMHAARHVFRITGSGPPVIIPQLLNTHFDPLVFDLRKLILARLAPVPYEPIASGSVTPHAVSVTANARTSEEAITSASITSTVLSWPTGTVDLDDESTTLIKLRADLEQLVADLKAQNDVGDPIVFSQVLQEISAGSELMKGKRVQPALVGRIFDQSLAWVVQTFPGLALAVTASGIYDGLKLLFLGH